MKVILDSTAIIHWDSHFDTMSSIVKQVNATDIYTTRINYLELLAGASLHSKVEIRKHLNKFKILEFTNECQEKANTLAMKHQVTKSNRKDFLMAAIAIANNLPLLTENDKHFKFSGLKVIPYRLKK